MRTTEACEQNRSSRKEGWWRGKGRGEEVTECEERRKRTGESPALCSQKCPKKQPEKAAPQSSLPSVLCCIGGERGLRVVEGKTVEERREEGREEEGRPLPCGLNRICGVHSPRRSGKSRPRSELNLALAWFVADHTMSAGVFVETLALPQKVHHPRGMSRPPPPCFRKTKGHQRTESVGETFELEESALKRSPSRCLNSHRSDVEGL